MTISLDEKSFLPREDESKLITGLSDQSALNVKNGRVYDQSTACRVAVPSVWNAIISRTPLRLVQPHSTDGCWRMKKGSLTQHDSILSCQHDHISGQPANLPRPSPSDGRSSRRVSQVSKMFFWNARLHV